VKSGKPHYLAHVDGLRAVAVLAVLGYHAFPQWLPGGFVGVDVFFVISGFLITRILIADFGAPGAGLVAVGRRFYARRVRRIFPALILVLLASYTLGFLLLLPNDLVALCPKLLSSAGFYLNFVLARGVGYFAGSAQSDPLLHLWSLSVEEQFYLLWPLLLWACFRARIRILSAIVFMAGCSYFWNSQKLPGSDAAAFFLPQMRFWELGVGAIGAALFPMDHSESVAPARRATWKSALSNMGSFCGVAMVLFSFVAIRNADDYPNRWALLPVAGTIMIIASSGTALINRRALSNPMMVGIGLISYPLYLWHWPLLSFAHLSLANGDSAWIKALCLALALALAWLTYRFLEAPLRRSGRVGRRAVCLLAAMALVAALAYGTVRFRGFPGRFSPVLEQLADFRFDRRAAWREGTYFLDPGQDERAFKDTAEENVPGKPTLYLWGDSYAAALYPGIRELYGARYNVVQRTAALTGAFITTGAGHRDAGSISRFVFASIARRRPEIVVIAGQWQSYEWKDMGDTLSALKAAGIPRVILVGPEPEWSGGLSQQLYNYMWRHRKEELPERLSSGVARGAILPIDRGLRIIAREQGAEYVSPLEIFGNHDGFLVRTGPDAGSLTAFDGGHLTVDGSIYLVSRFPR
jgi:peptidoglycan/LPS O-acetylase OafA/YrhL